MLTLGANTYLFPNKYEEVYRNEYLDPADAAFLIGEFLEKIYNQKPALCAGLRAPAEFEAAQLTTHNVEAQNTSEPMKISWQRYLWIDGPASTICNCCMD
jgi:hypothetical protein